MAHGGTGEEIASDDGRAYRSRPISIVTCIGVVAAGRARYASKRR